MDIANLEGRKRVFIKSVKPQVEGGHYPAKRVLDEEVVGWAAIYADGHDHISANLLYRPAGEAGWRKTPMDELYNDEWHGSFTVDSMGMWEFTVEAWVDHFATWQHDLKIKHAAGQRMDVELKIGAALVEDAMGRAEGEDRAAMEQWHRRLSEGSVSDELIEQCQDATLLELVRKYPEPERVARYGKELRVRVQRKKARFSTWYELFPRSTGYGTQHGTFADVERLLPEIQRMGFDVLYFPPIHPIGHTHRKGKNNNTTPEEGAPGSPWAIGSELGGHKSIAPELGTFDDFRRLVSKAGEYGLDIALDIAFQCSPDHPYVREHPEWFLWRPDGTIQYAENPPKKYEDIVPLNFETQDWRALWHELKSVFEFWIGNGVRIFRVDNPHTKSFLFWEWALADLESRFPDVIFLSEAFTRPKKMYHLAQIGFTQSYTYFTWRNTKSELEEYLTELTQEEPRDFFRPNFWPNTPDILPQFLQYGGKPAFLIRLLLAATLSSNYGIYGPAYELLVGEPFGTKEEYLDSEKYEIKDWNREQPGSIRHVVERINQIRRENPALQETNNLEFYTVHNDHLLAYGKQTRDGSNILVVCVNIDPQSTQSGMLLLPLEKLGIEPDQPFLMHDLFGQGRYMWQGHWNFVELNPRVLPAHVFRLQKKMNRETDFEQFV